MYYIQWRSSSTDFFCLFFLIIKQTFLLDKDNLNIRKNHFLNYNFIIKFKKQKALCLGINVTGVSGCSGSWRVDTGRTAIF
uniref:Uncharacterized protein n=1 Tax=Astyanax mexicanus TaxID=7994 RepID=A0A3B1KF43_ASTMX